MTTATIEPTTTTGLNKAEYTELTDAIAQGAKVTREVYDQLVAYAKKAKVKKPSEDAIMSDEALASATAEDKPKRKGREPKAKVPCPVTAEQDPKMPADAVCGRDVRAGEMCTMHYSRLVHRAKPGNAEKAREASKRYAAKQREAKQAAKAAAEATA